MRLNTMLDDAGFDAVVEAQCRRFYAPVMGRMQAVYNYTLVLRDPGAAYHNGRYAVQLLHDSLESLGHKVPVSLAGKTRP
jgi:hypothetical protein